MNRLQNTVLALLFIGIYFSNSVLFAQDYNFLEIKKMLASDAQAKVRFGNSVSVSGDFAIVGSPGDDFIQGYNGAAYILYRNQGGTNNWGEVKKLTASDGAPFSFFGGTVSISGDYAIVGAQGDGYNPPNGSGRGAAYIFYRNQGGENNWGQVKKIIASDAQYDHYFGKVSISGEYAVVGATGDDTGGSSAGAVYIFKRNEGGTDNWGQVKKITNPAPQTQGFFGFASAISDDYLLVGAPYHNTTLADNGIAYVFYRNEGGSNNWGLIKTLYGHGQTDLAQFGYSVALEAGFAIVGARRDNAAGTDAGAAYVYYRNSGGTDNWGEVKKISASDASGNSEFGTSVSLSGDYIVVGSPYKSDVGAAYVYSRNQGGADNWGEVSKISASDAQASDHFGTSVSVSGDFVIAGAPDEDAGGNNAGAAYMFQKSLPDNYPVITSVSPNYGSSSGGTEVTIYGSNFGGTQGTVLIGGANAFSTAGWNDTQIIFTTPAGSAGLVDVIVENSDGLRDTLVNGFQYNETTAGYQFEELKKIVASDAQESDKFGRSVSIFGDFAIIGAPEDNNGAGVNAGAAYIFDRIQGGINNWGEVKKLTSFDAQAGDNFGTAVSISGDFAIVGAELENTGGTYAGAAYLFYRNQGGTDNWGEIQKLTPLDAQAGDIFGSSVSISGNYAIVGASFEDEFGNNAGAAYLFKSIGGSGLNGWQQVAKLTASDAVGGVLFGSSVVISGDYAVIGAKSDGQFSGAAYVFYRNQGGADNWGEVKKLTASDVSDYSNFGNSVSLSGDYAIVGALSNDALGNDAGAAYVFYRNQGGDNNWGEVKKLTASDAEELDYFGESVSISGDYAVVGANGEDAGLSDAGAAYVFYRNQGGDNNWGEINKLTASDPQQSAYFGFSAAISGDYLLVGADGVDDPIAGTEAGAAYIFTKNEFVAGNYPEISSIAPNSGSQSGSTEVTLNGTNFGDLQGNILFGGVPALVVSGWNGTTIVCKTPAGITGAVDVVVENSDGLKDTLINGFTYIETTAGYRFQEIKKMLTSHQAPGNKFGYDVSVSGDYALVGSFNETSSSTLYQEVTVLYRNQGGENNWGQVKIINGTGVQQNDEFGVRVALWGDYAIVSAPGDDDAGTNAGAVYIFYRNQGGENNWGEVKKITSSDAQASDAFGYSVSISDEYAIVGSYAESNYKGAAYIYQRDKGGANNWGEVKKIIGSDSQTIGMFGSVTISGSYAVVGANGALGTGSGAAYIFNRDQGGNNNWGEVKKITNSDAQSGDFFGSTVSLSGNHLVVGAYGKSSYQGAAYMFYRNAGGDNNWGEVKKLTASDAQTNYRFGYSVSLSGDNAVVGSVVNSSTILDPGSAYFFNRNLGGINNWGEVNKITASDGTAGDKFGTSVSISGNYALIGAPDKDSPSWNDVGSVYIFENMEYIAINIPEIISITPNTGSQSGGTEVTISGTNFGDTKSTVLFGGVPSVNFVSWNSAEIICTTPAGIKGNVDIIVQNDEGYRDTLVNGFEYIETTSGYEFKEIQRLLASDAQGDDEFGFSVSISGDDAIVGAHLEDAGGSDAGAAYIYKRDQNGIWNQVTKLTASDSEAGDNYGFSVSISGNYAIVGAYTEDTGGNNAGAAYVYKRSENGTWSQATKLIASDAQADDAFGAKVSISGNYALVTSVFEDAGGTNAGAAYVYTPDESGNWAEVNKLTASDPAASDQFGSSAAISGDYLIVGASTKFTLGPSAGAAYIFKRDASGNWSQTAKLTASDGETGDQFGGSVAISGEYAIISAVFEDAAGSNAGAAYIFKRNENGAWLQVDKITASDAQAGDEFGSTVSISGDYAIVGVYKEDAAGNDAGAAYVYNRQSGGNWTEVKKLTASDAQASSFFGFSVAISGDYALVGAQWADAGANNAGAAYMFRNQAPPEILPSIASITPNSGSQSGGTEVTISGANFGDVKGSVLIGGVPSVNVTSWSSTQIVCKTPAGVTGSVDVIVEDKQGKRDTLVNGFEYIETTSGYEFQEIQRLLAADAQGDDEFGFSVSISGDDAIVGAHLEDAAGSDAGAAYIYKRDQNGTWNQVTKLTASDLEAGDNYGFSVSISGNYAIVGAYTEDTGGNNAGAAYVYKRSENGTWSEVNKLIASDAQADDAFGAKVSISGNYALVTSVFEDAGGSNAGAAYVYTPDVNGNWIEVTKLTASGAQANDFFGSSGAISGDHVIVGASKKDVAGAGSDAGAAYIFQRAADGNWTQTAMLTASDAQSGDNLGTSVSISGDYAIASAVYEDAAGTDAGASYIFKRNENGVWSEVSKITASDAQAGDEFGTSVSISGDYAIVGVYKEDAGGNDAGAAYIYKQGENGVWSEVNKLTASDAQPNSFFGYSVSVSGDYALVGAQWADAGGTNAGAVYIFRNEPLPGASPVITSISPNTGSHSGGTEVTIKGMNFADVQGMVLFGGVPAFNFTNWKDTLIVCRTPPMSAGVVDIIVVNSEGAGDTLVNGFEFIETTAGNYFEEVQKVLASDAQAGDNFGAAISVFGNTAIVGAPYENGDVGAAYLYLRNQNTENEWTQVKKLTASSPQLAAYFGNSVHISGDFAVVGSPYEDAGGNNTGAAYLYYRNQGGVNNWGEVKKITASDAQADDNLGASVSLSGDYLIVSADGEDTFGSNSGAAYLYYRNQGGDNNWGEVKKITAFDAQSNANFGISVSLSGEYAVVGAFRESSGGNQAGAAYLFYRNEGGVNNWGQIKKLAASDAQSGDLFGRSVSITGEYAVIGALGEAAGGSYAGAAYLYSRHKGGVNNWGEVKKITASDAQGNDYFGGSVSISGDYIVVGASGEDGTIFDNGAAYIYYRNTGGSENWGEILKITASDVQWADKFGSAVSISGDYVIVGSPEHDAGGSNAGAAYIFVNQALPVVYPSISSVSPNSGSSNGGTEVTISGTSFGDLQGAVLFGGIPAVNFTNWSDAQIICKAPAGNTGMIDIIVETSGGLRDTLVNGFNYIDTTAGYQFQEIQKLSASNAMPGDGFGSSVSISGNNAIFGDPYDDDGGSFVGTAYVFSRSSGRDNNWTEQKILIASNEQPGALFGYSVSLSGDYAVVGAPYENAGSAGAGAVYLFYRNQGGENNWGEVKKLTASTPGEGANFGLSVFISGDYLIVGAPHEDAGVIDAGASYLFYRNQGGENNWGEVEKMTASDLQGDHNFGVSVAISGDYAIVGAEGNFNINGGAYIFYRNQGGENNWGEVKKITASDAQLRDYFGHSVSLSGYYAVIGAIGKSFNSGAAYIFYRDQGGENNWGEVTKITASDAQENVFFGTSVSLSGNYVLVGTPNENENGEYAGAAYLFERNAGRENVWGEIMKITPSDASGNYQFGTSVSVSGGKIVIGASHAGGTGAVYAYEKMPVTGNSSIISVTGGWNIISVPLLTSDMSIASIFENAISPAYAFNNGYTTVTQAVNGEGYWLKYGSEESITVQGDVPAGGINVDAGWNIIGPFNQSVLVADLTTVPAGIIASQFYGFNSGYQAATELQPGKGYWIKASQAGVINLNQVISKKSTNALFSVQGEKSKIEITDAKGNIQTLYIVDETKSSYELPPLPPLGIFDVRYNDNSFATSNTSSVVTIKDAAYPVRISVTGTDLKISSPLNGINLIVRDGKSISISESSITSINVTSLEIPTEFVLEQNYPNPFNPSTTIKFGLPETAPVKLNIYNSVGEKILTLVDRELEAGFHEFQFSERVASGIYFYQIITPNYNKTKKMMLLK
ncbi:MAG: IPT/TIG domain-containing protein [Ignavibacteriales bacterium]|nr:IPT/TIG domain-containing protein [Ignavibacteriales bacterium]MCF8316645.1 IPT/TIG domain-containing protein [Ignavibacteriales bacterium]MCF8438302.1 IPT/TIG domain-containing protein [Ignavibacteriales bacterium]